MTLQGQPIKESLQRKAPYILAVAIALLIYETYLLQKSFQALYDIYLNITQNAGPNGVSAQGYMWFTSETFGEVGLILRLAGALFFVVFAVMLWKKKPALSYLKRGVLLEAVQYLFLVPFISQWVIFSGMAATLTIISFSLQIVLITPTMFVLYLRLRKPQTSLMSIFRMLGAVAIAFMFAMWIKHFFFSLYALQRDFSNSVLTVGFVNSAATLLVSALILTVALLPFIRGKSTTLNFKAIGAALIVASVYFFVYLAIAIVNSGYQSFVFLTELWMMSFLIVGAGFLLDK
jgi:hypothetical protein